ncbi:hypothetical protein C7B77_18135 [Chamaesiphon polymorphus CCALA 037]|uniref:Uncharacterized protein n=1 Tax=Chamaesiphon polymorphus CCALA 037 TaxID=2107692 RepID=A0A2T1GAZ4_9CYAN|nr:hypothetical protein C7B77_18135 [Chamaesiphon polymorphus CCALA 037]
MVVCSGKIKEDLLPIFYILKLCQIRLGSPDRSGPHPQPLSQFWERGARAAGEGGVRAMGCD